jgi:hypothetical protein
MTCPAPCNATQLDDFSPECTPTEPDSACGGSPKIITFQCIHGPQPVVGRIIGFRCKNWKLATYAEQTDPLRIAWNCRRSRVPQLIRQLAVCSYRQSRHKRLNVKPKKRWLIHCPMIGADRIVYTDVACGECEMRVRTKGRRYTFPGTRPD